MARVELAAAPDGAPPRSVGATRAAQSFVSALATVEPSPAAVTAARRAQSEREFAWGRTCDLAAQNWVLPAVAWNVARNEDLTPAPGTGAAAQLQLSTTAARVGIEALSRRLQPVCEGWESAGVRWALTKGAALIASIYPPASRLLNDVDVLVAPEDYERARGVLVDRGFAAAVGAHREEDWRGVKGQVPYANAGHSDGGGAPLTIDLHCEMYGPSKRFRFDTQELLSRRQPAQLGQLPVSVLDPADLLLHLATQLLNDRLVATLLRLADLSVLFARVEPGEAGRRASAAGSTAALEFARVAVCRVFPEREPIATVGETIEGRGAAVAAALVARGWPWAERLESLPETYRQAAADVVQDGVGGALAASLRRGCGYRRDRRRSGASAVRSTTGGLRMAVRGVGAVLRVWTEL